MLPQLASIRRTGSGPTAVDEPAAGILFAAPVGATLATVSGTVLGGMIPRWKPLDAYEEVEK